MTPDDMLAGPEMDRLIAEKVMGWTAHWMDRLYRPSDGPDSWEQTSAPTKEDCRHTAVETYHHVDVADWFPSTDIDDAMEVVERWKQAEPSIHYSDEFHGWSVGFMKKPSDTCATGDDLALTICRAALKAFGGVLPG